MTNIASERAREMRKQKTPAERELWRALRELNGQGSHFRQQAPVGPYIADFCDHSAKLIVEVDGGQHGEDTARRRDAQRTVWLESQGYRVLRFWNVDVLTNLDGVMTGVMLALGLLEETTSPPPSWGRPGGGDGRTAEVGIPPTPCPSPQGGGER